MSNRNNDTIRRAIQRIAQQAQLNAVRRDTTFSEISRVTGYVAKIHDDPNDELFGTIDVQEFNTPGFVQEDNGVQYGYHEGVLLSALEKDREGYLIVPKLYSEVMLGTDPESGIEYVTMFSHVDLIQLDSHDKITVGVREREPFDMEDEDSDDISELKLTGQQTNTTYTKDAITSAVQIDKDGTIAVSQKMNSDGLVQTVGDRDSVLTMTEDGVTIEHDKAKAILDDSQARMEMGNSSVTVNNGTVYVGNTSGVDDAVLGQQLASILSDLVGYLGQMMTPTMMGPQAPANVLANFIALKTKIQTFATSHSGFLTQKVQLQK